MTPIGQGPKSQLGHPAHRVSCTSFPRLGTLHGAIKGQALQWYLPKPPALKSAAGPSPGQGRGWKAHVQTCDASALEGLGNDGCWLVLHLPEGLAQFLHAVPIYDDSVPTGNRDRV